MGTAFHGNDALLEPGRGLTYISGYFLTYLLSQKADIERFPSSIQANRDHVHKLLVHAHLESYPPLFGTDSITELGHDAIMI